MITSHAALIVVDVQLDFCEGGALPVAGGNQVAVDIAKHIEDHGSAYDLIVASQDWHRPPPNDNGGHFAEKSIKDYFAVMPPHFVTKEEEAFWNPRIGKSTSAPDYKDSWPVHCVAGSQGARLHPALKDAKIDEIILKGHGQPSYSAFDGSDNLCEVLRKADVQWLHIVGLAFDYCVKATALDAVKLGFKTNVIMDLAAGINWKTSAEAGWMLADAGVQIYSKSYVAA